MRPIKAREMKFGASKQIPSNAEWPYLKRSPKGLAIFPSCCVAESLRASSTLRLRSLAGPQK